MEVDRLVEEFIARYEEETSASGLVPDPSLEQLLDMEDEMDDILGDVGLTTLTEEARNDLRGKRSADLPDLMAETAEGLRGCPQIQQAVQTSPEAFERVAAQDLAVGGLVQSLQAFYRRADNGVLWTSVEAESLLDKTEAQVSQAINDPSLPQERRNFLEFRFTDALAQRRRPKEPLEITTVALDDEERLARAKAKEAQSERIRSFVRKSLAAPGAAPGAAPVQDPKKR